MYDGQKDSSNRDEHTQAGTPARDELHVLFRSPLHTNVTQTSGRLSQHGVNDQQVRVAERHQSRHVPGILLLPTSAVKLQFWT
jgi:hypothetical protein